MLRSGGVEAVVLVTECPEQRVGASALVCWRTMENPISSRCPASSLSGKKETSSQTQLAQSTHDNNNPIQVPQTRYKYVGKCVVCPNINTTVYIEIGLRGGGLSS